MDPLGWEYDDDAEGEDNGSGSILSTVEKVHSWIRSCISLTLLTALQIRKIVHAIYDRTLSTNINGSIKWTQTVSMLRINWYQLMPILNVRTQWTTTHQMMCKCSYILHTMYFANAYHIGHTLDFCKHCCCWLCSGLVLC